MTEKSLWNPWKKAISLSISVFICIPIQLWAEVAGLLVGIAGKPEPVPGLACSSLACWMNSSGDRWDPWQAQTIRSWVALYLYVTPDIVLPFGPGPVVLTHGRFGKDPHPPNFTSAAMPGLITGLGWLGPSVAPAMVLLLFKRSSLWEDPLPLARSNVLPSCCVPSYMQTKIMFKLKTISPKSLSCC